MLNLIIKNHGKKGVVLSIELRLFVQ